MKYRPNRPLKICIICHGLGAGGIESFVVSLASNLKNRGNDVKIVMALDDNGYEQLWEKTIRDANIETFRTCDQGTPKRIFKHLMLLYNYLKTNRFDIVHSNMSRLNGLNLAISFFAGVKIRVAHSHAVVGSEGDLNSRKSFAKGIYHIVTYLATMIFANRKCGCSLSATQYAYGKNSIKRKNVFVIYNGIDIDSFSHYDSASRSGKTIITVGRIVPIKNPEFILRIMCELKSKGYNLVWVGSGSLDDEIHKKAVVYGLSECVSFLGVRGDIPQLLFQADAFLLTSLSEGLSIATIEAQAAGLPCIVSTGVPIEVNCGLCEFISLDESPQEWATRINEIVSGHKMLKLDKDKLERFSVNHMVEQTLMMYKGE